MAKLSPGAVCPIKTDLPELFPYPPQRAGRSAKCVCHLRDRIALWRSERREGQPLFSRRVAKEVGVQNYFFLLRKLGVCLGRDFFKKSIDVLPADALAAFATEKWACTPAPALFKVDIQGIPCFLSNKHLLSGQTTRVPF